MNRRGWLRVVEAFLGIMIITGVIFMQMKNVSPSMKDNVILIERSLLKEIARNNSIRGEIMGYDVSLGPVTLTGNNITVKYIENRIPSGINFSVMLCAPADPCVIPNKKNVFAQDAFISCSLNIYQPRKIKIFMWGTK